MHDVFVYVFELLVVLLGRVRLKTVVLIDNYFNIFFYCSLRESALYQCFTAENARGISL